MIGLVLAAASTASLANAQNDSASAEALFRAADALMKSGKPAEACPKLEESQRLDPAPGTLFKLGDCYEAQGRFASAWARYTEALQAPSVRASEERTQRIKTRIDFVEAKLSKIAIVVPAAVASLPGIEVKRDGIALGRASWGVALPVDSGPHSIQVAARGKQTWAATISVAMKATENVNVPDLPDEVRPATPTPSSAPAPVSPRASAPVPPSPTRDDTERNRSGGRSGQLAAGFVVAGAGLVTTVAGVYFLNQRGTHKDNEKLYCTDSCPDVASQTRFNSEADAAQTSTTYSVISLVLGAGLLTSGVILLLTAPAADGGTSTSSRVPLTGWVAPSGGGIGLSSAW